MIDRRTVLFAAGASAVAAPLRAADTGWRRLVLRGGRLFVAATVAGRPCEALLDSGAEMTVVDSAFAGALGLGGDRQAAMRGSGAASVEARFAEGVPVTAAGLDIGHVTVAIADLGEVARRLVGHVLPAIIGREFFDAGRFELDIDGGRIRRLSATAHPGGIRLPLTAQHGIETIPVVVEGRPAQASFDLGNGTGPMLSAAFAAPLLADGRSVGRESGGGLGGARERRTIEVAAIEVAGRRFAREIVRIEDGANASDANVGTSILRHFRIVTDYPGRAVWLGLR